MVSVLGDLVVYCLTSNNIHWCPMGIMWYIKSYIKITLPQWGRLFERGRDLRGVTWSQVKNRTRMFQAEGTVWVWREAREIMRHPNCFVSLELLKYRQRGRQCGNLRKEPAQGQPELELYPGDTRGSLKVLNRGYLQDVVRRRTGAGQSWRHIGT